MAQQTFLFPDTLRNKNTPLLTDSSDKLPNTQWVKQQHFTKDSAGNSYILNQRVSPQVAAYYITDTTSNSAIGYLAGFMDNNYIWSSGLSTNAGATFGTGYSNATFNFNLPNSGTLSIGNGTLASSVFDRLVLSSSTTGKSSVTLAAGNNAPRTISALSTQVLLTSAPSGDSTKVSGVASLVVKSAYEDPSVTNSVRAANYFQLLIEPSDDNINDGTNAFDNQYGIYQAGDSDINVLKGPLAYQNKYATSAAPTASNGSGAGTSPTITITGTTDGGVLKVITGSSPGANATITSLTFTHYAFPSGCSVVLYPASASAAALSGNQAVYVQGTATGWTVSSGSTALAGSTTYQWNYQVSGY